MSRSTLHRKALVGLGLAWASAGAVAGPGLAVPSPEALWPQWGARVALHTSAYSPVGAIALAPADGRQAVGASLLGDYTFATPGFGSFRASGGLLFGSAGGAPMLLANGPSRVGLALLQADGGSAENMATLPYLGLGFSSQLFGPQLAVSADLGWVAERPGALGGLGRAVFGNAGAAEAWRQLRVSPVLQLGLRYAF